MDIGRIPTTEEVLDYIEESARKYDYTLRVITKLHMNGEYYYSCMDDNYTYSFHQWIPESIGKQYFVVAQFLYEYDKEEAYGLTHNYEYDLCDDVNSKFTMFEYVPTNVHCSDDDMWD